jgi:FkbM family methyltransferase
MKSVLRNILSYLIKPFGYSLIGTSRMKELYRVAAETKAAVSLETHLARLIEELRPDCVFDVGANDGGFAKMLRGIGYKGWIVSFEPLPNLVKNLKAAAEPDTKWQVEPYALGSKEGEMQFNQMAGDVFSSFLIPGSQQPEKYNDSNSVVRTLMVPIRTVDRMWPVIKKKLGVSRLMLKLDTQGFDLEVFAGAGQCIHEIPLLLSELACVSLYENAPDYVTALSTFASKGYQPAIFAPISFTDDLRAIEMDGVFVKCS